ncbi:hypothetical protein EHP00_1440 [Ecytonucleospora hepatopenaei]|uniref:Uncharacterized protein n=1 Tax=Ecytonucleospora hepatopenaei TaxID=646526 RepID=A0A1W0E7F9_9MICR|nr:hypothetical protein EHP00_1440 [Ecytonucleospora hepatopenaei]
MKDLIEIEIDFTKQKEIDLKPKEEKKRKKFEDYDYDDDFLERFEGDDQLVDLDCNIENFFVYKGEVDDNPKRIARKYKYQEQKDLGNTFEFENKLKRDYKKDAKFHNLVYFLVYLKYLSIKDKNTVDFYLLDYILRNRNILSVPNYVKTKSEENVNNSSDTSQIINTENNTSQAINTEKNTSQVINTEKNTSQVINTEKEGTEKSKQNQEIKNSETQLKTQENITGSDVIEDAVKTPLKLTFTDDEITKFLENKLKSSLISQHEELKKILADINNYSENFKSFNYKKEYVVERFINFIVDYTTFYYKDQDEKVRSKGIAIIQKLFANECTNKRVKASISMFIEKNWKNFSIKSIQEGKYILQSKVNQEAVNSFLENKDQ